MAGVWAGDASWGCRERQQRGRALHWGIGIKDKSVTSRCKRVATAGMPVCVQTMLRVKDPKVSLDFYTRVMGMTLLTKFDFADMKFRCGEALGETACAATRHQ